MSIKKLLISLSLLTAVSTTSIMTNKVANARAIDHHKVLNKVVSLKQVQSQVKKYIIEDINNLCAKEGFKPVKINKNLTRIASAYHPYNTYFNSNSTVPNDGSTSNETSPVTIGRELGIFNDDFNDYKDVSHYNFDNFIPKEQNGKRYTYRLTSIMKAKKDFNYIFNYKIRDDTNEISSSYFKPYIGVYVKAHKMGDLSIEIVTSENNY